MTGDQAHALLVAAIAAGLQQPERSRLLAPTVDGHGRSQYTREKVLADVVADAFDVLQLVKERADAIPA